MKKVRDEQGREYELAKKLGEGGQGAVFLTQERKFVVKLIASPNPTEAKRVRNQLTFIRRQSFDGLPIAQPLSMLAKPSLGYVMELAEDMEPISSLIHKEDIGETYLAMGGLRRRIHLLRKLAYTLAGLHGKGMIYADLSPANVFISDDVDYEEVFLIDTDNIRTHTAPRQGIYTPFYGAPELVRGKGTTDTYTDAWAFAVLAFEVLCCCHPLLGDIVNDGEPEMEEKALRCELPWIENSKDDENYSSIGIPRELVLPKKLRILFRQTFEDGMADATKRPSLSQWEEVLYEVEHYFIECPNCTSTYFFNKEMEECPFCEEARPPLIRVITCRWEPRFMLQGKKTGGCLVTKKGKKNGKPHICANHISSDQQSIFLTRRDVDISPTLNDTNMCEISFSSKGKSFGVTPLEGQVFVSLSDGKKSKKLSHKTQIPAFSKDKQYILHFKPLDKPQRVFLLNKIKA